jgi:hypothetical protein
MGYWQWFNTFLRSEAKSSISCSSGNCTKTLTIGGCDSVNDPIAFRLMKPQLEEELNRFQAKSGSLKDVKKTIVCHYPEGTQPSFEQCTLG